MPKISLTLFPVFPPASSSSAKSNETEVNGQDDLNQTSVTGIPSSPKIPILANSFKYDEEKLTIELTRADGTVRKFVIIRDLTESDLTPIKEKHPLVARKLSGAIDSLLGEGTFSSVRLAKDNNNKFYAVRSILNKPSSSKFSREQVIVDTKRELKLHSRLRSKQFKNITLLIEDAVETEENGETQIYQFLPLADLGNGSEIIRRMTYLKAEDKQYLFNFIVQKLLGSMLEFHQENITVNDIKPENILFTSQLVVSFSDFGAVTYLTTNGARKQASPLKDQRYLAPFSIPNDSSSRDLTQNKYCDLWALGLTLIEFLEPALFNNFIAAVLPQSHCETNLHEENLQNNSLSQSYQEYLECYIFSTPQFRALNPALKSLLEIMLTADVENQSSLDNIYEGMGKLASNEIDQERVASIFKKIESLPDSVFNDFLLENIKGSISTHVGEFSEIAPIVEALNNNHHSDYKENILPHIETLLVNISGENPARKARLTELLNILGNFCSGESTYDRTSNALTKFKGPQFGIFARGLGNSVAEPQFEPVAQPSNPYV